MDDDLDSLIDAMRDVSSSKAQSQEAQEADELTAVHRHARTCSHMGMQLHAADACMHVRIVFIFRFSSTVGSYVIAAGPE